MVDPSLSKLDLIVKPVDRFGNLTFWNRPLAAGKCYKHQWPTRIPGRVSTLSSRPHHEQLGLLSFQQDRPVLGRDCALRAWPRVHARWPAGAMAAGQ